MSGQFGVDPDALRKAVKKLEDARDKADQLARQSNQITPGELTAKDRYTEQARKLFTDRVSGPDGSLRSAANDMVKKLQEKIDAYNQTLAEYGRAEDNATADAQQVERQS